MSIDATTPRTRRSLLAGALGGLGAAVAATLAGAQRALGAGSDGATVQVGYLYPDVRRTTRLQNQATTSEVFIGQSYSGTGLRGESVNHVGVFGYTDNGTGVQGSAVSEAGVGVAGRGRYVAIKGESTATGQTNGSGVGVFGTSRSTDGAGVDGRGPNVGVHGQSPGVGVFGESAGVGVRGLGRGDAIGVLGNSDSYRAVVGVVAAPTGPTIGVMGESFSAGGTGVRGWAAGDSTGVLGYSGASGVPDPVARTGVYGYAGQDGRSVGIRGTSPTGRGGLFSGKVAQVRLVPSQAATHPAGGALGDLFLDKTGRLWLCKGGPTWVQVA